MYTNLFQSLEAQTSIVITANQRLANYLRSQYDQYQQTQNKQAWHSLDVLPLSLWAERCWRSQWLHQPNQPTLLSAFQLQAIWEQIIATATVDNPLLCLTSTATQAMEAWHLLKQASLTLQTLAAEQSLDVNSFYQWAQKFEQLCTEKNWLDADTLIDRVSHAIELQIVAVPKQMFFVGFYDISPQFKKLLTILSVYSNVSLIESNTFEPEKTRLELSSTQEEIALMAYWAKQQLQENPNHTIACIVPKLTELYADIDRSFTQTFHPEFFLNPAYSTVKKFNLSANKKFAEYGLINSALQILSLNEKKNDIYQIGSLLRSPYVGHAEEMSQRAILDEKLRDLNLPLVSLTTILNHARKNNCLLLAKYLHNYQKTLKANLKIQPSAWSAYFTFQLQNLNWPGSHTLTSTEYQTLQRWQELLQEFASLDSILGTLNLSTALHHLHTLVKQTYFQPKTTTDAPIQILGALEASGLYFDAVWIMGLDIESWPPSAQPNPFIPIALQIKHQMPHATPAKQLAFYQKLTKELFQSTSQLIVSSAQQAGEKMLQPSQLIQHISNTSPTQFTTEMPLSWEQRIFAATELETIEDIRAPAITEKEKIRGGTYLFKQQAACPFRAFAEIRLQAYPLNTPEPGLSTLDQGILLHEILAALWGKIKDQQQLRSYSENKLATIVEEIIDNILQQQFPLEKRRLNSLLMRWLAIEKNRPEFKVIHKEKSFNICIGKIKIAIKVDRIDELEDGSQIIIDYKTGQPSIYDWFGDRPSDPQLPIYCSTHLNEENNITGIAFAQIRSSAMKFSGIAQENYNIAGINTLDTIKHDWPSAHWKELIQQWRQVLEKLADDFYAGHALVDPKNPTVCEQCHMQSLCRIHGRD